jgi:hypothetical protein
MFGASSDLQISHNGSNSVIEDLGEGNLKIKSNGSGINFQKGDAALLTTMVTDGAVTLYHNSSAKIATTSTGIDVTGTVTADGLTVNSGTTDTATRFESTDGTAGIALSDNSGSVSLNTRDTGDFSINVGGDASSSASNSSEALRIDSSGNLLVGTTSYDGSHFNDSSGGGFAVTSAGKIDMKVDGTVANFNKTGSDGNILYFAKQGAGVGSISCYSNELAFISGETGLYFDDANNQIYPLNSSGSVRDDITDLGTVSSRFDDIFATNGTIQTSDENEKQNIASLTSAEITAAKAISKLFKTFKWKSKVAAKGDAARTHTGVVAQQVQKAMSDAGIDATKYAFWCSDTWTNDDGNEQTRMGVRYPELLAFVGAATEQRLADIETRLAALES